MAEKAKHQFNGQPYAVKGGLCHVVVKYYVEQNPNVTLEELKKIFNNEKNMIVVGFEEAMDSVDSKGKMGGDYYVKEADLISIKEGNAVVWNYWPERYFFPFLEQVKALGYSVTEQNESVIIEDNAEKAILPKDENHLDALREASKADDDRLKEPQTLDAQSQAIDDAPLPKNEGVNASTSGGMYDEQLEQLIESALADGVLTDNEKKILLKRAQSKGMDPDEFEMVLEARLYKMNNDNKVVKASASEVIDNSLIDYEKVKELADFYYNQYNSILYYKDGWKYENIERKSKSGKTVITNQYRKVKITVKDWGTTNKKRRDYVSTMVSKTKEEMLAVIVFLGKFMPIADESEINGSVFFTMLKKYHTVVTESRRLYSSDSNFMELLKTVSTPFSRTEEIVDRAIPKLQKRVGTARRGSFFAKLIFYLYSLAELK